MSESLKVAERIDFSKAIKNPFAKIAKAAKENNGSLPPEVSKRMMREAIEELHTAAEQNKKDN